MSLGIRLVGCFLLALLASSCGGQAPAASSSGTPPVTSNLPPAGPPIASIPIVPGQPIRVLFVGNSLTQANDLPSMVTALAAGVGVQIQSIDVSQGGFSLEDHWNDKHAPQVIDQGGWHFVVLQQGPSALLSSRENLRLWAGQFNQRIRAVGGRPAIYMVWPEAARIGEFENVRQSYLLAAQDIKGLFLPAGDAWRAAWQLDPALKLYGSDDFHPSVLGTYTAALVITSKITSRSPNEMPNDFVLPNGVRVTISQSDAALVQAAAAETMQSE